MKKIALVSVILQLLQQLNNLYRSKTIACSASFCFGLSLRFPCPLPKRISSRILSKSMFITQNHPKSQQRVRTCAVIEKPVFRASLALSMLEIELYQISLPYDRGRSGYEISICPSATYAVTASEVQFQVHLQKRNGASCSGCIVKSLHY